MAGEVLTDFSFYRDVYGGSLSDAAFLDVLPKAHKHVCWLIGYTYPSGACEIKQFKRAVCAAVDVFADFGDGAIGFTLGSFKTAVREGVAFSAESKATEAALKELGMSGLTFCGVR